MKQIILFTVLFIIGCSGDKQLNTDDNNENVNAVSRTDTSKYTVTIFTVEPTEISSEGFGFEITGRDGQGLKIRQPNIPAIQGNQPFISEENARATAELMIDKLEKGIMPPAISVEELDSIGVVY
jgi:hypothetical protein